MRQIPERNRKGQQFISCFVFDDWLYQGLFSGGALVIRENLSTGTAQFVNLPNSYIEPRWSGCSTMIEDDGILYLIDNGMSIIFAYDPAADTYETIELGGRRFIESQQSYSWVSCYDHQIFIFPAFDNVLYLYDISTKRVKKIKLPLAWQPAQEGEGAEEPVPLIEAACQDEKTVVLFSGRRRCFLTYDLATRSVRQWPLPFEVPEDDFIVDSRYHQGKYYVATSRGVVYVLHIDREKKQADAQRLLAVGAERNTFERILATDRNLWLLPDQGHEILVFDFQTGQMVPYQDYPADFAYEAYWPGQSKFYMGCRDGERYIFSMCASNYILSIGLTTGKAAWRKPARPDTKELQRMLQKSMKQGIVLQEGSVSTLESFITAVPKETAEIAERKKNENMRTWARMVADL